MVMCFNCAQLRGLTHLDDEVYSWYCNVEENRHLYAYTFTAKDLHQPVFHTDFAEKPASNAGSYDFQVDYIGYEMKTNNKSKLKKNGPAQILVSGLLASDSFCYVTEKQFYSALTVFGYELRKDSRLKQTHKLETFYVLDQHVEYLRTYGIETALIGFKQYNSYVIHEKIFNLIKHRDKEVDLCSVDVLLAALTIREFYQEREHANKIGLS